jgi:UDP:flavonoid glycosyltransferase YjiC (YdhE family)
VEAAEFSKALAGVVENESMLARSRELAKLAAKVGGRANAADKILAFGKPAL